MGRRTKSLKRLLQNLQRRHRLGRPRILIMNDHLFYYMRDGHLAANPILNRVQVLSILNAEQRLGEIAEIGVFEGEYTEQILQNWEGQRVIGVDPYFNFTFEEY